MTLVPASQYCDELVELPEQRLAARLRLENDHVRRRGAAVGFNRRRGAAHVLFDMRLAHAPIGNRRLDERRDFRRLAEHLNGDARNGIDLRGLRRGDRGRRQLR